MPLRIVQRDESYEQVAWNTVRWADESTAGGNARRRLVNTLSANDVPRRVAGERRLARQSRWRQWFSQTKSPRLDPTANHLVPCFSLLFSSLFARFLLFESNHSVPWELNTPSTRQRGGPCCRRVAMGQQFHFSRYFLETAFFLLNRNCNQT